MQTAFKNESDPACHTAVCAGWPVHGLHDISKASCDQLPIVHHQAQTFQSPTHWLFVTICPWQHAVPMHQSRKKHAYQSRKKHAYQSHRKHAYQSRKKHAYQSRKKHAYQSRKKHAYQSHRKHAYQSHRKHARVTHCCALVIPA